MAFSNQRALYPARAISGNANVIVSSQQITVSTTAVTVATTGSAFTATPAVGGSDLVTFDVQTSDVRCRFDGTAPTSTVGHLLPASTAYTWQVDMFNNAQFIRDSLMTVDAVIFASPVSL